MPPLLAFDAANPNISIRAMVSHGAILAPVYVVGTPGGFPHADRARVLALRAAGLAPYPNWERAADFFARCSIAEAEAAGVEALAACRELGFPDDGSIDVAFSFDYQLRPADYPAAAARLAAAERGLAGHYRAVAYGQIGFVEYLAAHGWAGRVHWLMASTWRASSRFDAAEAGSPHVGLVQSHDAAGNWLDSPIAGTDVNTVTNPHAIGAWWPPRSPYATPSPSDLLEEIMTLPGAPKGLTYQQLLDDVEARAQKAANSPLWAHGTERHAPDTIIRAALGGHVDAQLAAVATVVNDTVQRVAKVQAAVASLPAAGQPAPAPAPAVDVDALSAAVAAAVVAELGKLSWGVK